MAGTVEGGRKAAAKNLAKNPKFYSDIGREGGKKGTTGGFAYLSTVECNCDVLPYEHTRTACIGSKGGRKSRRKKQYER